MLNKDNITHLKKIKAKILLKMDLRTPPQSPRSPSVCPGAPIKKRECDGCRQMMMYGYGAENQEAHMGDHGCLNRKE